MATLTKREVDDIWWAMVACKHLLLPDLYDRIMKSLARFRKPKRAVVAAKKSRFRKTELRRQEVADLRTIVMTRAQGRCEHCGINCVDGSPLELDHFAGGSNRRFLESVEGCWALASVCHRQKTRLTPTAEYWLSSYIGHCERHGYWGAAARARNRLAFVQTKKSFRGRDGA